MFLTLLDRILDWKKRENLFPWRR